MEFIAAGRLAFAAVPDESGILDGLGAGEEEWICFYEALRGGDAEDAGEDEAFALDHAFAGAAGFGDAAFPPFDVGVEVANVEFVDGMRAPEFLEGGDNGFFFLQGAIGARDFGGALGAVQFDIIFEEFIERGGEVALVGIFGKRSRFLRELVVHPVFSGFVFGGAQGAGGEFAEGAAAIDKGAFVERAFARVAGAGVDVDAAADALVGEALFEIGLEDLGGVVDRVAHFSERVTLIFGGALVGARVGAITCP